MIPLPIHTNEELYQRIITLDRIKVWGNEEELESVELTQRRLFEAIGDDAKKLAFEFELLVETLVEV